jgi:hypothetical protein
MTDSSFSTYAPAVPGSPGTHLWACTPGQRLMRQLPLHGNLLLLWMSLWLPALPAALLLGLPLLPQAPLWKSLPGPALALAVLVLGWVVSSYLLLCAGRLLSEAEQRRQRVAVAAPAAMVAETLAPPDAAHAPVAPAPELAPPPSPQQAPEPPAQLPATMLAAELADARVALQMHQQEIGAAVGELARRTVALCGMLDANVHDVESAQADLEAIQDEERGALQLMAALRARLLELVQHCHALAEAARAAQPSADLEAIDRLAQAAAGELTQCHQLSERVGGAERLNERRIESMRRSTDRLLHRAERGMHEAQQLMVLTRQVQAAQGASLQRLEQIADLCRPRS